MPLNSPKRPPYWNSTRSGFDLDHITAVDMSFCTSLRNCIQTGPPSAEKMTSCRFSKWRISAILYFRGPIMGSLKSPCMTSYRSLIDTIALNCLVFQKIAFFCILATDRRTNKQMDSIDALSRSRCRERRLNKAKWWYCVQYARISLFLICFSQGSVATRCRCGRKYDEPRGKFTDQSNSAKISKIDHHLIFLYQVAHFYVPRCMWYWK